MRKSGSATHPAIAASLVGALLLSACDGSASGTADEGSAPNDGGQTATGQTATGMSISPPAVFANRRVRVQDLDLLITVDGQTREARRDEEGNWQAVFTVPLDREVDVRLVWAIDGIELATLSGKITARSANSVVSVDAADGGYRFPDNDNDSATNLEEIDAGTDPNDPSSFPGSATAAGFNSRQQNCLVEDLLIEGLGTDAFRDDYNGTQMPTPPLGTDDPPDPIALQPGQPITQRFDLTPAARVAVDVVILPEAGTLVLRHTSGKPDAPVFAILERRTGNEIINLSYNVASGPLPRTVSTTALPAGGYCIVFAAMDTTEGRTIGLVPWQSGERSANDSPVTIEYELIVQ